VKDARTWLRADAFFDAAMALLLLTATWDALYEALGLPVAEPALYAQIAGGLLLGYAYLLWWAPGTPAERTVAGATAVVNALGVVVVGVWVLSGDLETETLGDVILWAAVVALAAFAIAETSIARRAM
jgi:hypothetical protein